VGCAPARLNQKNDFFDSPQNRAIGLRACYTHGVYGQFEQPGAFWGFGDLAVKLDRPPPMLGEHTREILTALGYGLDEPAAIGRAPQLSPS
jgi:crotonobetainyl-CoA:carnitine CoA-transferase CaiB-like acyl-CoA transferase